jgi:integrase
MKNHFSWTLGEKKYLRLDEVKQLRNFCKRAKILALRQCKIVAIRDWFLIELGLNTGLRVDEIRNLRFGDLGIEGEMSSLVVKRGKGGKSRVIRISSKFKRRRLFVYKK